MANWVELMGWGARLILVLLFSLSIWSVAIMFDRRSAFKQLLGTAKGNDARKLIGEKNWSGLKDWAIRNPGIISGAMLAALEADAKSSESVDRSVQSFLGEQKLKLEKGLNVLATLGANAPFIGLFGTVLGIVQSFGILSSQQGSAMTAVMLGLAEALVATAVGLFVAIPASVSYNYFGQKLRKINAECVSLRDYYISKVR